jgi:predicted dehydrogenase
LASQALEAGRRVVMEKPLAPTLDECHSLLQQAKIKQQHNNGGMLIVSEQSPYWQEIVKAKELLEEGAIGTLVSAASYYYESMRDNVTSGIDPTTGGLGWRTSLKRCGGGVVIDGGLHWLRPLRELCGDMEQVVGVTRRHIQPGLQLEGESLAHALLKIKAPPSSSSLSSSSSLNETETDDEPLFDYRRQPEGSGALVVTFSANMMHTAPMAHDSCPYFRLTGTKGELVVAGTGLNPNGGGGLKLYHENDNDGAVEGIDLLSVEDRQGGFFVGFQGIWRVAGNILRRNDHAAAVKTVRDAAADVAVALALYKSSESHQWEPCELFDDIPIPNP